MAPKTSKKVLQRKNCNKNGVNVTGKQKSKMKTEAANYSNTDSEEDEQSTPGTSSQPAETPIKVTLKKTKSCSSTSSRESTQSFKVVKSVLPSTESVSGEDGENQKDSDSENSSNIKSSDRVDENENGNEDENDNESDDDFHPSHSSSDEEINENNDDEILSVSSTSSTSSQESSMDKIEPAVSVKDENKDSKELGKINLNTEIDLKTEEAPQINPMVKKEEFKVKVKSLKEECLKEAATDVVVVKDDDDDDDNNKKNNAQTSKSLNENEKTEVKEHKYKLNVRSFDQLAYMPPPGQPDQQPHYLTQNGAPFPPPLTYMSCEVCGLQFDSSELLNEHKSNMKHFKCSLKDCEHLVMSNHQEYLDHQRLIHNIMPTPVQQLSHQVQRIPIPAMGFDQHLQSGVPPLPENLPPPTGVPNLYTQTLRMPSLPLQRSMRPIIRSSMPHMMTSRGRGTLRGQRGRPVSMSPNMGRGNMKRPQTMPLRGTPPLKRTPTLDRNSSPNNSNKTTPQFVKSLSESLTKSISQANKVTSQQQEVVNLFSKRGLTISTVDKVNNISIPAALSLNSAVTIIPSSPRKNVDTVDLTGPDKPSEKKFWPCEVCSKTYLSIEKLYEHLSVAHKSQFAFKCNFCGLTFPNADILNRHKTSQHKSEVNSNIPFILPIIDISKPSTIAKLQSMGVTNYVPVAQLDQQGSHYGLPIMSISRPGSIDGLKFTNFLNLGCVRKL